MTPRSEVARARMYTADRLSVDAIRWSDGALSIEGQDLGPHTPGGEEYEYFFTVEAPDVRRLLSALGGTAGDDVLVLLAARGEAIVTHGEMRWLRDHDVPFSLQTW